MARSLKWFQSRFLKLVGLQFTVITKKDSTIRVLQIPATVLRMQKCRDNNSAQWCESPIFE